MLQNALDATLFILATVFLRKIRRSREPVSMPRLHLLVLAQRRWKPLVLRPLADHLHAVWMFQRCLEQMIQLKSQKRRKPSLSVWGIQFYSKLLPAAAARACASLTMTPNFKPRFVTRLRKR